MFILIQGYLLFVDATIGNNVFWCLALEHYLEITFEIIEHINKEVDYVPDVTTDIFADLLRPR